MDELLPDDQYSDFYFYLFVLILNRQDAYTRKDVNVKSS